MYELLYQDYCAYLKAKGESPVALVGDKEKDKDEKERFKATFTKNGKTHLTLPIRKTAKANVYKK